MSEIVLLPDRPWPIMWESDPIKDTCPHDWETVTVESRPNHFDDVDRCRHCLTPRCSSTDDQKSPCVERRHHSSLHIYESGSFTPLGGYLLLEDDGS